MDIGYAAAPLAAWLLAGITKFGINSLRAGRLAFAQIGYGGMPSNHSAIVSSAAAMVALREGMDHPAFGVAVALAFVVMLDASSLRRKMGQHAELLNRLNDNPEDEPLRERMGHTRLEIGAGILTGTLAAWMVDRLLALYI